MNRKGGTGERERENKNSVVEARLDQAIVCSHLSQERKLLAAKTTIFLLLDDESQLHTMQSLFQNSKWRYRKPLHV